jgi:hypothetical protein
MEPTAVLSSYVMISYLFATCVIGKPTVGSFLTSWWTAQFVILSWIVPVCLGASPARNVRWETEGPKKVTRGVEWEAVKIPLRNSSYIPKAIDHQNRVGQPGISAEDDNRCKQGHVWDFGEPKMSQQATQNLMHIATNTWCAWLRTHHKNSVGIIWAGSIDFSKLIILILRHTLMLCC